MANNSVDGSKKGKKFIGKVFGGSRSKVQSDFDEAEEGYPEYPSQSELSRALEFERLEKNRVIVDFQVLHKELQTVEAKHVAAMKSLRQVTAQQTEAVSDALTSSKKEVELVRADLERSKAEMSALLEELALTKKNLSVSKDENSKLRQQLSELNNENTLLRQKDPKVLDLYNSVSFRRSDMDTSTISEQLAGIRNDVEAFQQYSKTQGDELSESLAKVLTELRNSVHMQREMDAMKMAYEAKLRKLKANQVNGTPSADAPAVTADDAKVADVLEDSLGDDWRMKVDAQLLTLIDTVRDIQASVAASHLKSRDANNPATQLLKLFTDPSPLSPKHTNGTGLRKGDSNYADEGGMLGALIKRAVGRSLQESLNAKDEAHLAKTALSTQHIHLMTITRQLIEKCSATHAQLSEVLPTLFPVPEVNRVLEEEKVNLDKLFLSSQDSAVTAHAPLSRSFDRVMRVLFTIFPMVVSAASTAVSDKRQLEIDLARETRERMRLQAEGDRRLLDIHAMVKGIVNAATAQHPSWNGA